jgi:hypothetical protein
MTILHMQTERSYALPKLQLFHLPESYKFVLTLVHNSVLHRAQRVLLVAYIHRGRGRETFPHLTGVMPEICSGQVPTIRSTNHCPQVRTYGRNIIQNSRFWKLLKRSVAIQADRTCQHPLARMTSCHVLLI